MFNNQAGSIYEEDHEQEMSSSTIQMSSLFSLPPSLMTLPSSLGCHQSLKAFTTASTIPPNSSSSLIATAVIDEPSNNLLITSSTITPPKQREREDHHLNISHLGGSQQLLSLLRSTSANLWEWGDVNKCSMSSRRTNEVGEDQNHHHHHHHLHHLGLSAMKMKKIKLRKKVREPRFCFKTMSDVDVLDDGYKWRKYGQKVVKNTQHPRSYYRCTQDTCRVKKRVERLAEDPRMVITTYEGRHVHSPSHDLDDSLASSSGLNNFFW